MSGPRATADRSSTPHPHRLLDFAGRTVVVTGAGSGIGMGIALRFAQAGANVVVNYRASAAGAAAVAESIKAMGGDAVSVQANVTREADVADLVAAAVDRFGALDVMVNNAGIYPRHPLIEMNADAWDDVVDANLRSAFLCTQAAARQMIASGAGGAIVNVASIEAENPAPDHSHYVAAKGGLVMYGMAAAGELGRYGIRVNTVSPGLIWQQGLEEAWPEGVESYLAAVPLGRLGLADDVADACLFLASPAARWISGANLRVDGGVMTHRVY